MSNSLKGRPGLAQESKKLSDALADKDRELAVLAEMNREIHSTMHLDRLLRILVEKAVIGVNFERGLIYLLEDDYLRCVAFLDRVKKDKAALVAKKVGFRMTEKSVEVLSARLGKSIYIRNAAQDARVSPKFLQFSDVREYCAVPLIGRDKVLGVFTGDKYYSRRPILPEDIATLELFAGHISLAIENAELYEEKEYFNRLLEDKVRERTAELAAANEKLSVRMNELSALVGLSQLMNQSLLVHDIVERILPLLHDLGPYPCSIHLSGPERIETRLSPDLDLDPDKAAEIGLAPGLWGRIGRSGEPFVVGGIEHLSGSPALLEYCARKGLTTALVIPLFSDPNRTAALIVYAGPDGFAGRERADFFSAFGNQARVALERAYLFEEMVREKDSISRRSARLERENLYLRDRIRSEPEERLVVGESPAMKGVLESVGQVAGTEATVMIFGETGTGKELVAQAVHAQSRRSGSALITVNCAAIPEELLESELFGHEKGAFTGAHKKRIGMFELAHQGTLFLDEIGEMSLNTQKKLLRALQEQEIQPLGAKGTVKVDVRVLAATNKDLRAEMEAGNFRPDLFYRLNVFPIRMPPLRERPEDLEQLVEFFLDRYRPGRSGKPRLHPGVMAEFQRYSWPGNIRELKNIIERLTITAAGGPIVPALLPREFGDRERPEKPLPQLQEALRKTREELVEEALARAKGKKAEAARMLGLAPSNFSRLLKTLGLK